MLEKLFGADGAYHRDLAARTTHPVSLRIYQSRGGAGARPRPETHASELAPGDIIGEKEWQVQAYEVIHHQPYLASVGYRVTCGGRVVAYTSDVRLSGREGPVKSLHALARDADVLVHYLNGFDFDRTDSGVLSKQQVVAVLARDAGVKTLVTTHHGPAIDRNGVRERVIADIGAIFTGNIVWGEDLMTFDL